MFKFSTVLLGLTLIISPILSKGQWSNYEKGQAAAMFATTLSNSIKESKVDRLSKQKYSIDKMNEALSALEKDNMAAAYTRAEEAMVSFPKYSLSYLIMSYAALQKNDFLNSNRLINLYEKYSRKEYNKNLSNKVPSEFVTLVKDQSSKGFSQIQQQALEQMFKTEPWLDKSLEIQLQPGMHTLVGDAWFGSVPSNFPEFVSENNVSLVFKKYLWLNKKNALPYSNNNLGVSFFAGANVNVNFPASFYPANFRLFMSPGLFINKVHISPLRIQYSKIPSYSKKYIDYSGKEHSPLKIMLSPEVKWYPGVLNAYATDVQKLSQEMKSNAKFAFGYISFKYFYEELAGYDDTNGGYSFKRDELLFGFGGYAGKNRMTEIGIYLGPGGFANFDMHRDGKNYFMSLEYFKAGITISKRIL